MAEVIHYVIHKETGFRYICNQACAVTSSKASQTITRITCMNCRRLIEHGKEMSTPQVKLEEEDWVEAAQKKAQKTAIRDFMRSNTGLSDNRLLLAVNQKFKGEYNIREIRILRKRYRARYKFNKELIFVQ